MFSCSPPVQISESEGGSKITLITSVKEVREVIYNVVKVANVNSGGGQFGQSNGQSDAAAVSKRSRRKSTIAGGVGRKLDKTLKVLENKKLL